MEPSFGARRKTACITTANGLSTAAVHSRNFIASETLFQAFIKHGDTQYDVLVPHTSAADAKVTVVVFDDLGCVFCARLYTQIFPETLNRFRGLVRIVYKE